MAQSIRQSNLFVAEDWKKIYRAFLNVNFVSYDFDTIRESLINYIRINYAEDFNDFIESSEFISIIDILAWLGQSLAFRVDLNARENFIDTAERRESILKLAKLISYKPRRNIPASGFLKITGVQTNDDIIDSNGTNLNGLRISWNDVNNPDWYEQFILILNEAFIKTNPFGNPVQSGIDASNVKIQTYEINSATINNNGVYGFDAIVDGIPLHFENVPVSWSPSKGYEELPPNPFGNFRILYKNDGLGNNSKNTGFFTFIKQGTLQFELFNFSTPIENRLIDINVDNINDTDVWVQSIDDTGMITLNWTKVPVSINTNIVYNNIPRKERNIFSVETRENDQISIRFSDGRFGNIPLGIIKVNYRVSIGRNFSIKPIDIKNTTIELNYLNSKNIKKTLTLFLSLQETISNSSPAETNEEIKINAPQVFYTQNRMVTGEDYNTLPLTLPVKKVKAINRTYAGHSRFIDINDPTGVYQNTNVIGEDGLLYKENFNKIITTEITNNFIISEMLDSLIIPEISSEEFKNFIIDANLNNAVSCSSFSSLLSVPPLIGPATNGIMWDKITGSNFSSTGRFVSLTNSLPVPTNAQAFSVNSLTTANTSLDLIRENSLIKFKKAGWVSVSSIISDGRGPIPGSIGEGFTLNGEGMVRLNKLVEEGDELISVLPNFRTNFNTLEKENIINKISSGQIFGLFFDFKTNSWVILDVPISTNINGFIIDNNFDYCDIQRNWMILFTKSVFNSQKWEIYIRSIRYVFESEKDVRFFFVKNFTTIDKKTGKKNNDTIKIFSSNLNNKAISATEWDSNVSYNKNDVVIYQNNYYEANVSATSTGAFNTNEWNSVCPTLNKDYELKIYDNYTYSDGYIEPRRVLVTYTDNNSNGSVDDPEIFKDLISNKLLFWTSFVSFDNYVYFKPIDNVKYFIKNTKVSAINSMNEDYINTITRSSWVDKTISLAVGISDNFKQYFLFETNNKYTIFDNIPTGFSVNDTKIPSDQTKIDNNTIIYNTGRNKITFLWKHFAPEDHRIDPSVSNIIDIFVLDSEYDSSIRQYIKSNNKNSPLPSPPSSSSLALSFQNLNELKMISDEIIWNSAKYKILFGEMADEELRATFKVVKSPNATFSDGEIKAKIIELIDIFFNIDNWDFGETFYFSELAAFIHQNLALQISSFVLVPKSENSKFGTLFEIKSEINELFISSATVNDIEIIESNTKTVLKIGN